MLVRRPGTAKRPDAGLRRVSMIHFFPIVLDGEKCLVLAIHGQMTQAIATLATRRHALASPPSFRAIEEARPFILSPGSAGSRLKPGAAALH